MKFINFVKILILIAIAINIIEINSSFSKKKAKITRGKRALVRTKTKGISTIFSNLSSDLKKPENIFYFVLGVFGEFLSGIDDAKKSISFQKAKEYSNQCNSFFEKGTDVINSNEFSQMERILNSRENKKDYCLKTKATIRDYYVRSHSEDSENDGGVLKYASSIRGAVFLTRAFLTNSDNLCAQILSNKAPIVHREINKKYSSQKEFLKQCVFFDHIRCSEFNPEASGISEFAKKCTGYYKAVNKFADCLKSKIPAGDSLANVFSSENLLKTLITNVASVVANVMTFGIWGGLNGGYHLVQLGLKINDYLENPNTDSSYKIGGIVGRAMKIILSVSGIPTVRKLRFKKMRNN
jgi:hypothetical protein